MCTVFSLLPIHVYASIDDGGDNKGSGNSGGTGGGTWRSEQSGYRMYIVDEDGKIVSNRVDVCFSYMSELNYGNTSKYPWIYMFNTKFEPFDGTYPTSEATNTQIYHIDTINEGIKFYSPMPAPLAKKQVWNSAKQRLEWQYDGNGENLKKWLVAGEYIPSSQLGYGGTGGSTGTNYKPSKPSGSSNASLGDGKNPGTTPSKPPTNDSGSSSGMSATIKALGSSITRAMDNTFNVYRKSGKYSKPQAIAAAMKFGYDRLAYLKRTGKYSSTEMTYLTTRVKAMEQSFKYGYGDWQISAALNPKGIFDTEIIDLAYAADTNNNDKNNIVPLLNGWLGTNWLFRFTNGTTLVKNSNGEDSVLETIAANNYRFCIEATYWFAPAKVGDIKRWGYRFYGTVTNYAQLMHYNAKRGWWTDGGSGGHMNPVLTRTAATALYPGNDFIDSTGKSIVKHLGSTAKIAIPHKTLMDHTVGYDFHWYCADPQEAKKPNIPETSTYDDVPDGDTYRAKTPIENKVPHPAINPAPPEKGGKIPLLETELKEPGDPIVPDKPIKELTPGYLNTTRTIHIVKCYDILHEDGTLTHVTTNVVDGEPGIIDIRHEPDYKVVGHFSSEDYFGFTITPITEEVSWDWLKVIEPTENTLKEWEYETVKDKKAGDSVDNSPVKIGVAADPDWSDDLETPRDPDPCYNDIALYIHLVKKDKIPETSTYDEPDNPPIDNPPYVPPHPAEDPTKPDVNDPETDPVEPGNKYCNYRIVKVYDTKYINSKTGEAEIITDNVFSRYPTNPIVHIQDEGQNNPPKNDPSWHLIEWMYGNEPDGFDENNLMSGDEPYWNNIIAPVTPKKSGTSPTKVNLIDPENYSQVVVLYVHLRRTQYVDPPEPGKINIEQSQISKTIHSNDKNIGDKFGDYKFDISIGNFQTQHSYTYTIPVPYGYTDYYGNYISGVYNQPQSGICQLQMPGTSGDNQARFVFDQIGSQHKLEVKLGTHSKTDARVYGNGGASGVSRQDAMQYPETVPGMTLAENHFKYTSDGKDSKGAEYVTVLWRGGAPKADIPTLAKFKEKDIKNHYGVDNWEIPNAMLKNADRKSRKQRATMAQKDTLSFQFGFSRTHSAWDEEVYASCLNMGAGRDNMVGCIYQDKSKRFQTMEGTSWQYPFKAAVAIQFYAGKSKSLAAEAPSKANIQKKGGAHYVAHVTQGKHQIKFYPYIRMTYMLPNLDDAIAEEANTYENGHPNPGVRYDTYVLAERESSILPSDAIQLGWKHKDDNNTLTLTSQQWSLHKRAISGSDGWQGRNQVLPGGAIYQLATKKDDPAIVQLITYNTVVDDKARQEYLTATNTIPSDVYVVGDAVDALKEFVNDAKEVLDNLNIVQWVNKNANASTAWNANFQSGGNAVKLAGKGEDLSPLNESGRKVMTANLDDKYYMRGNTFTTSSGEVKGSLTDFQSAKISDRTYEIRNNTGKMKDEQSNSGDLDVSKVWMVATVYKAFTDTQGNVYYAKREKTLNGEAMENAKVEIENMVKEMKDINGDNLGNSTLICGKTTPYSKVNELLNSIDKGLKVADDLTKYVTNTVKSVERNTGDDSTASWVGGTSEKRWYNEAFDGFYLVKQEVNIETTFQYSPMRVATLDPALCPVNRGQSDLYTKAFLSQFCVDSRSDAAVADGKGDHYIGTYDGVDMFLPDMELMYQSKKFYIPNANVQDLN